MRWPTVVPPPGVELADDGESISFSVIIAAYQAADHLGAALASVLAQTDPADEVIVVDDGSTDDIASAVDPYRSRITFLEQDNQGEAAAKNRAVAAARSTYVVILDADDAWEPERLAALGALARARPDLDILTTDAWFEVDGVRRGRFYDGAMRFPAEGQAHEILDRCFVMPHAAVRRRRWLELGGFDPAMRPASDWDFYLRAVLGGSVVGLVDAPLAIYRLRPESMSGDRPTSLRARVRVLEKAAAHPGLTPELRAALIVQQRRHERRARVAEAESALLVGGPGARRAALRLVGAPGVGVATRVKGALACIMPALAARLRSGRSASRLSRRTPE